jgi:hypothetical protein
VTNRPTLASLAPIPTTNPPGTHATNRSTTPATLEAALALPATFGTTPAPMEEVLDARANDWSPCRPCDSFRDYSSNPFGPFKTNSVNPATIQATPALPATLAAALEPMVGVVASLVVAPVIIPTQQPNITL